MRKALLSFIIFSTFLAGCAARSPQGGPDALPRVFFACESQAQSVCVSGDFNDWSRKADCLSRNNGRWETTLAIEPGRYAYVFVINGNELRPDPQALLQEDDGFGHVNSILVVP